jgi:hypothetical protein
LGQPTQEFVGIDRVLETCADAVGLKDVKSGFARSDRSDKLFALGWPNLRILSEAPLEPAAIEKDIATIEDKKYPAFRLVWPQRVARRLLRRWSTPYKAALSEAIQSARAADGPITEEEARIMAPMVAREGPSKGAFDEAEDNVLLFEACVGPSIAATLLVDALDAIPDDAWASALYLRHATLTALGTVLLRVPERTAAELRGQLEALWQRHSGPRPKSPLTRALDAMLHGGEGVERSGYRIAVSNKLNPRFCTLLRNDPGRVLAIAQADMNDKPEGRYHAALAFCGATPVVDLYAPIGEKFRDGPAQEYFIETFGEIESSKVDDVIREMSKTSKAKKRALAWLAARGS